MRIIQTFLLTSQSLLEKFVSYRYTILFGSIIILLGITPFVEGQQSLLMPPFILLLILAVLRTLDLPRRLFQTCVVMGVLAILFHLGAEISGISLREEDEAFIFLAVALSTYAIFLGIAITAMIRQMFAETQATIDTIRGGIAVYFLLGILWAFLFRLLLLFDREALAISNYQGDLATILYFSFTTLTTLGYGDILPLTWQARSMTITESTVGQIYMTVLIARLVGLSLSSSNRA